MKKDEQLKEPKRIKSLDNSEMNFVKSVAILEQHYNNMQSPFIHKYDFYSYITKM